MVIVPTRATPGEVINPCVKSSQFLSNILSVIEANPAWEGIRVNEKGYITEGTISKIFAKIGDALVTSPSYMGLLKGITRQIVIELVVAMGITVQERPITKTELITADEVFLTFTSAGVLPVVRIGGWKIGEGIPGRLTKRVIERYSACINTKNSSLRS